MKAQRGAESISSCLSDSQESLLHDSALQGGRKIGEPDRLRAYRCLIKIPNGRLNEKDLHVL